MWPTILGDNIGVVIADRDRKIYAELQDALTSHHIVLIKGKGPGAAAQCVREAQERQERKANARRMGV